MYKVGDKVRVVKNTCSHGESVGEILEVVRIDTDEDNGEKLFFYSGGVNGDENGWKNYFLGEDIEKLLTDPIESLFNHFKGLGKPEDIYKLNK